MIFSCSTRLTLLQNGPWLPGSRVSHQAERAQSILPVWAKQLYTWPGNKEARQIHSYHGKSRMEDVSESHGGGCESWGSWVMGKQRCLVSTWVTAPVTGPLAHPQQQHQSSPAGTDSCLLSATAEILHLQDWIQSTWGNWRKFLALLNTAVDFPTVPAVLVFRKRAVQKNIGLLVRGMS